ncbi:MAG TPA: DUF2961 domain-containing protein [Kiritimatiellia bacterium]|nr:DUF2961 domain-containing protein [Kiritimatiellia bacterium]
MFNTFYIRSIIKSCSLVLLAAGISSCGKPSGDGRHINWQECLEELTDFSQLPSLTKRQIDMYSTYDRTGGNNDFNNFHGRSKDPGWVVLVDLKGPGCIRRFWMTGSDPGHPIRIYLDGEKNPSIDTTIDDLFGKEAPWTPPLAQYVNMCFYSYLPITYNRSIRIEIKEPNVHPFWGPRRLYFQINAETFSAGTTIETLPRKWSEEHLAAVARVGAAWDARINSHDVPDMTELPLVRIQPGEKKTVFEHSGRGIMPEWHLLVQPYDSSTWSRIDQEFLLQDTILRIFYNGNNYASIETPLGDFFANAWRKRSFGSWWMTSGENGYSCRLPLPFSESIRIEIENGSDREIAARLQAEVENARSEDDGYLHAEFRRSGPDGGLPHLVTRINGRGKFIGCFLGVTGLDPSWWILEGDERMWVDSNPNPFWQGTGLEDYFNGGWYYRGAVFHALSASFDRAPFRVAQYRHHHPDPLFFDHYFMMDFERMNQENSGVPVRGTFRSVAYSYLAEPVAVQPLNPNRQARRASDNPFDREIFMLQLVELERMNDFHSAMRMVEEYLERFPESAESGVYKLRLLEYRRYLGKTDLDDEFKGFLNGEHGDTAKQQAELLKWFYEHPNRAIVGMNVNGRGRLAINNQNVLSGDHPYNLFVTGMELTPGTHQIATQVDMQRAGPWLQVGVRSHTGVVGTGPGTWSTRSVDSGWRTATPDPRAWHRTGIRDVPRGVPDAPYIGGIANAFILVQSKSYPISGLDWSYYQGTMYFRQDFDFPIIGWPAFSRDMTGLKQ